LQSISASIEGSLQENNTSWQALFTELSASSQDEFLKLRSLEGRFSGSIGLREHG
jgi:hypothetical protein